MTQPLADEFPLGTEQPVRIVWLEANMPDEGTRFTFTYKPDPQVYSIHPVSQFRGKNTEGKFMNILRKLQLNLY